MLKSDYCIGYTKNTRKAFYYDKADTPNISQHEWEQHKKYVVTKRKDGTNRWLYLWQAVVPPPYDNIVVSFINKNPNDVRKENLVVSVIKKRA